MVNGKQKGASFEREVCVALSRWISSGKQDDIFWRSAMSGGRATVAAKKGGKRLASQAGDISCIHPTGHHFMSAFAVECKHYRDLEYKGLLTNKGKFVDFWKEISKQAAEHGKTPFLVARQNRMPTVVCLSKTGIHTLRLSYTDAKLICPDQDMYLILADHFFKVCNPYVVIMRRSSPNRQRARLI